MVFSSSASNFLTDPILKAFQKNVNEVTTVIPRNLSEKLMSELDAVLVNYIFDTVREEKDAIDAADNPYSLFFNNKCIHPILVEEYKTRSGA